MLAGSCPLSLLQLSFCTPLSLNTFFQTSRTMVKCCCFHTRVESLHEMGKPSRDTSHKDLPQSVPHNRSQGLSLGTGSNWSRVGMKPAVGEGKKAETGPEKQNQTL